MGRLCLMVPLCTVLVTSVSAQPKRVPTWNQDVALIMVRYCTPCHAPGGLASARLVTYETARPLAASIMGRVLSRGMPPRATELPLSDRDVRTVVDWVTSGAPRGEPVAAGHDPSGVWALKTGFASRAVVLVVARQPDRFTARIGPSQNDLREADSCTVEKESTVVVRDGALTYTLTIDGATVLGVVTSPDGTEPVSGSK